GRRSWQKVQFSLAGDEPRGQYHQLQILGLGYHPPGSRDQGRSRASARASAKPGL
ncbi:uncharacterized protein METZ01_LOCUS503003, partial [marine metagenome]